MLAERMCGPPLRAFARPRHGPVSSPQRSRAGLGGTQLMPATSSRMEIITFIGISSFPPMVRGCHSTQSRMAWPLAKSINAKVTIITVSTPFHTFSVEPEMVTDTLRTICEAHRKPSGEYLNFAKDTALAAGVNCDTVHVEHDHPVSSHYRHGGARALRSHRHGIARPAWSIGGHAGQRNSQGADTWHGPGSCCPRVASGEILAGVFCAVEMLSAGSRLWECRSYSTTTTATCR